MTIIESQMNISFKKLKDNGDIYSFVDGLKSIGYNVGIYSKDQIDLYIKPYPHKNMVEIEKFIKNRRLKEKN